MKKKMYKAKKQWVIAGVTTASLLVAPGVLAEEAAPAVNGVVAGETTSGSENVTPQPTNGIKTTSVTADSSLEEPGRDLRDESSVAETDNPAETSNLLKMAKTPTPVMASSMVSSSDQVAPPPTIESRPATETASNLSKVDNSDINIRSHVENIGWQKPSNATQLIGTVGQSKRLEALELSLGKDMSSLGGIVYQSHIQNIGWQRPVKNGELSGTVGQSKRLEAVNVRLTQELAAHFDLYYRVHVQDYGWLGWAKNGANAGTEGLSKRLEALEMQILPKGARFTGSMSRSFIAKDAQSASLSYQTYIEKKGWQGAVSDGHLSGSTGQNQQLESLKLRLHSDYLGHLSYQTHIQNVGWTPAVREGQASGQENSNRQIEAVRIALVGEISQHYDVYYRVHSQNKGWLDWAKNGSSAGTEGFSLGVEGIEVTLVKKGGSAPGTTVKPFEKKMAVAKKFQKVYPMPYFNQRDPRWSSKRYGRYTMGDTGCVPTSLSMVFSALTGKTVMPTTVADWLYYNTKEFDRLVPGTRAPGIVKAANAWGVKATNLSSYTSLVTALREGHHVLAAVQNNVFVTRGSHELVLKGYNNGKVYVTDPYTKSLSGWYAMSYLFNTRSTDKDDTALGLPFFKISRL
ncbi:C39 family peptidase [Streptococcus halotolerans]|uniref:C39 family peptidase n=1 Tax=Streptococcus halotolerans TaxID=1814128 RepID=UPI000788D333|nr:C39 family peptidase [Streptococcus halotolerans]